MASASASYRNRQPQLSLEVLPEQNEPPHSIGSVCRDLETLCAMGILEAYVDMYGFVRYRPVMQASIVKDLEPRH